MTRHIQGPLPVLLCGLTYAAFSLALHLGGNAPSFVLPLFDRHGYYLLQSLFVVPLFLALWLLLAAVAAPLAGARTPDARARTRAALAPAYALPQLLLFLVPDIVVFAGWGFDAIAPAMRYYAPVALLVTWAACAYATRHSSAAGWPRALAASFAGLLAQALVGGALLR